jgi:hypothetical protein
VGCWPFYQDRTVRRLDRPDGAGEPSGAVRSRSAAESLPGTTANREPGSRSARMIDRVLHGCTRIAHVLGSNPMVSDTLQQSEPLARLAALLASHGVRLPLACGQAGISDGSIMAPATWTRRVRDTGAVLPLVDGGALVLLDARPDPSARPAERGTTTGDPVRLLRVVAILVRPGEPPALVDGRALRVARGHAWRVGRTLDDVRRTAGQGSAERWPVLPDPGSLPSATMAVTLDAKFPILPIAENGDATQVRIACVASDTSTNGAHGTPERPEK